MRTKVSVIYYSSTGTVYQIAHALAVAATGAGAEVRLRRVPELAPQAAVDSRPQWRQHLDETSHIPYAGTDDVIWADGVLIGTPTRFGNVSSQIKQFIDTLGGAWYGGQLAHKAYGGFTCGGSRHGGVEMTLATLNTMFCHFGGVVVAPAVDDPVLAPTANPYGTSHTLDTSTGGLITSDTVAQAEYQAARLVAVATALRSMRDAIPAARVA